MAGPRTSTMRTSTLRRAAKPLAIAALIWIAVVVLGAGPDSSDSLLGVKNLDVVWLVVFVALVILSVIAIYVLRPSMGEVRDTGKSRSSWWIWLILGVVLWIWQPNLFENLSPPEETETERVPAEQAVEGEDAVAEVETVAQLSDLLLLGLAVAAVGLVAFLLLRRSDPEPHVPIGSGAGQLHQDVLEVIEPVALQLRQGDDPRTGVLNAYATLESVLTAHDSGRRISETPTEHLRRVLTPLPISPEPFVRLAGLYEIARFSEAEITRDQQQQAAAALDQAKVDLAR